MASIKPLCCVVGLLVAGVVMTRSTPPTPLYASDGVESTEPIACPGRFVHTVVVDGIWFDNVTLTLVRTVGGNSSMAIYDVEGSPLSRDGRWVWDNGGATISCSVAHILRGNVRLDVRLYDVLDNWGPLRPKGDDETCDSGGGGDDPPWETRIDSPVKPIVFDPNPASTTDDQIVAASCTVGGGGGGEGLSCHEEWVELEVSYDGGSTWEPWWSGYATVCEAAT